MDLNADVLDLIKTYPTDGTHMYDWPKAGPFDGVTVDLFYGKDRIAKSRPDGCTYCCGITFEVWFRAAMKHKINLVSTKNVGRIKLDWFVATGKRGGPATALIPRHLGIKIGSLDEAKPGDFIQLWRQSGSGHSVVYVAHNQHDLTYWSTQKSSNGIGQHTEHFATSPSPVKNPVTELYITRALIPIES